MNYLLSPEAKPAVDVGDPSLALTLATALNKLNLIDVGGSVVEIVEESAGVVVHASHPVGFVSDANVSIELVACGPYDGTWNVKTFEDHPDWMFLHDAVFQGNHSGGKWKIKEQRNPPE